MSKTSRKGKAKSHATKTASKKKAVEKTSPEKATAQAEATPARPGDIILAKHRYSVVSEVLETSVACTYVDLVERRINSRFERLVPFENITAVYRKVG